MGSQPLDKANRLWLVTRGAGHRAGSGAGGPTRYLRSGSWISGVSMGTERPVHLRNPLRPTAPKHSGRGFPNAKPGRDDPLDFKALFPLHRARPRVCPSSCLRARCDAMPLRTPRCLFVTNGRRRGLKASGSSFPVPFFRDQFCLFSWRVQHFLGF